MGIRIKICGITREADAEAAADAGADALGLNFAPASPRRVDVNRAAAIAGAVRGRMTRVGVFVDADADAIGRVLDRVELDMLQFHGAETGDDCRQFGLPFMKALRVREPLAIRAIEQEFAGACCLLLDAYVAGVAGGTGQSFDWRLWPTAASVPLILAGGLTPDNVHDAVHRLQPWGVDVCGGVEGPEKGIKDPHRVRKFIAEVERARS
jgi:phosphoribosylanthranilate isomerase